MKLSRLLTEPGIVLGIEATSERDFIEKALAEAPDALFNGTSRADVAAGLLEREARGATVLGDDAFLPHARIDGLANPVLLIATAANPVEVTDVGHKTARVRLAFILATPAGQNTMMLQAMAAIARLLNNKEEARALLGIKSAARMLKHIADSGIDIKRILIAADIMRPDPRALTPEMTLAQAVKSMVEAQADCLPVIGKEGELVGELGADQIFGLGVPKFLSLLTDTTELVNFEAFGKFFESEHDVRVQQHMAKAPTVVKPESSVMSVAHALLTSHASRAFVVERNVLVGEILRLDILRKVFSA